MKLQKDDFKIFYNEIKTLDSLRKNQADDDRVVQQCVYINLIYSNMIIKYVHGHFAISKTIKFSAENDSKIEWNRKSFFIEDLFNFLQVEKKQSEPFIEIIDDGFKFGMGATERSNSIAMPPIDSVWPKDFSSDEKYIEVSFDAEKLFQIAKSLNENGLKNSYGVTLRCRRDGAFAPIEVSANKAKAVLMPRRR